MKNPTTSRLASIPKAGFLILALLAGSKCAMRAADISWIGGTASYNNAANWNSNSIPGASDNAINDNGSANVVQINTGDPNWSVNDIRAGNGAGTSGAFYQDGLALTLSGWFRLGIGVGATGQFTLHSGTIAINANRLNVGESGTGILNIASGTITGPNNQFALADGPTGASGTVNQTGGTVNSPGELWIGANNAGSGGNGAVAVYNLSAGNLNINNWVVLGRNGTTGTLNMTGGTLAHNNNGRFLVASGNGSIGTLNQSGGSITSDEQFLIPDAGDATTLGTYNISNNATLLVNNWIAVGRNSGYGIANIAGGSVTKTANNSSHIVLGAGGPGTINQTGGTVTNITSDTWIGENSAGTWNLNGGSANLSVVHIAQGSTATGTLNVSTNGTLITTELTTGNTLAPSYLNLDGGTIRASASSTHFLHDIFFVSLLSGGVTFDSQGFNLTIPEALPNNGTGTGGLTKTGSGTLTLTGANSYSGPTVVSAGKLVITTDPSGAGDYTVSTGAELSLTLQAHDAQLNMANLTLSGATVDLDLGGFGNPDIGSAPLNASGTLTKSGVTTFNITDALPQIGQFPLIAFSGVSGAGTFVLGTLPPFVGAYLSNNVSSIDLVITNVNLPRWEGLAGGDWDINLTTNWINIGNGLPTFYGNGNAVLFNDAAGGTTTVNLTTTVSPVSVTMNNNTVLYTLVGTGKISGNTGLSKQGASTASIFNTGGNNFTGPVVISGGVLEVTNLANGGSPSAIGASSANPTNLVLSGGALSYAGPAITINRGYLTQQTNSSLTTVNNLTLTGVASATSAGGLVKSGDAQLTYATAGSNVLSGGNSPGYIVQAGTVLFDGSTGGQTNVSQGKFGVDGITANATVILTNTTMNVSSDLDLGDIASATGTMTMNSGTTLNISGWFIFGDGGSSIGTFNLNAGTLNANTGDLLMGGRANSVSTLNINGGVFNKAGGTVNIAPGNWNENGARTATINQIGGTFNCSDELRVGQAALGNGYYNLSGGILNAHNWLEVGNGGSTGTFTMTGGTINKDGNAIKIGNNGGCVGIFNQSGGTINSSSEYWVAENPGAIGTNNISGTAAVNVSTYVTVGRNGLGVVNMSGGTFTQTGSNPFYVGIFGSGNGNWNQSGGALSVSGTMEIASTCTGNFQLDNGVVNVANQVWIAQSGGANGTVTINGGAFTNTSWLAVGREDGHGTLNINGGTMVKTGDGNISIAHGIGDNTVLPAGTVNQTGGTFIAVSGDTWIGEDSGPGIWNISGGSATMNLVQLARNASATGELDLNGGNFAANEVTTGSSGTSTLNFNGGTLAANVNNANFLHGLTAANVLSGGAVIDSRANAITISQNLSGIGGLTKLGLGALTLTGSNSYAGSTLVSAGKLGLNIAATGAGNYGGSDYTVANGAELSGTLTSASAQLNMLSLTLATSAPAIVDLDLGSFGNPTNAPLNVTNALTVGGAITVNIADALPQIGQFKLIKYGSLANSGSFVVGTLPQGVGAYISNNVSAASIDLVITNVNLPRWEGLAGGDWDISITTNWINIGTGLPTFYGDGNAVVFNDLAAGTTNVNLVANVSPISLTLNNTLKNYTLTGAGKISGGTGLSKQGTGAASILNTGGNNFTGPVLLSGGTLIVTNLANGGVASAIGASSANATNLVFAGGALSYGGPAVSVNRNYSVQAAGGTIDAQGDLTISGLATAVTGAAFTKSGPATLAYTGVGTNTLTGTGSDFLVKGGTVTFGSANGGQTNLMQRRLNVGAIAGVNAAVMLTNATVSVTGITQLGNSNNATATLTLNSNATLNSLGSPMAVADGGGLPCNGVLVQNSGTLNLTGELWVGQNTSGTGSYTLSSGTVNSHNWFTLGRFDGKGTMTMTGGTINKDGSSGGTAAFVIGTGAGNNTKHSVGVFNFSGGTITSASEMWLAENTGTEGTNNMSGTAVLNLNNWMSIGRGGHGVFNFSGGTINHNGGNAFIVGDGGNGFFNQSGGILTTPKELWIGQGSGAVGRFDLSAGSVSVNNWIAIGRGGASGTLNMSGGTLTKTGTSGNNLLVGADSPGPGTINQSGGIITSTLSGTYVGNNSTGTWNLSGSASAVLSVVHISQNSGVFGTVNLNAGGTMTATEVTTGNAGGKSTLNFNGGTLAASTSTATFLHDLATNNILAGGAVIDSGANVISIAQPLLNGGGGGGLTKIGSGTLYLNGISTYTGITTVSNGILAGLGSIAGPVSITTGAKLGAGAGAGAIGALTVNNTLTFAPGGTSLMKVDLTTNDVITGLTSVTYNNANLVVTNISGSPLVIGQTYKLFNAGSPGSGNFSSVTIQPSGFGSFNPATGVLTITAGAPVINPPQYTGGNLILTGTGGTPGSGYTWLSTTNLITPVANWITNTTGTFDGAGAFSNAIPVSVTEPARFFRLRTP